MKKIVNATTPLAGLRSLHPNAADVTRDVTQALKTLDARFSDAFAKVDTAVSNASRIWKLPGTYAR